MSDVWQALSNPHRRQILGQLKKSALTAGAIGDTVNLSAATLSQHLKVLRQAGLVTVETRGTQRIYRLRVSVVEDALTGLLDLLGTGEASRQAERDRPETEGGT